MAVATQAITATFTAGLTLYLVRALGPDEYGLFALAVGIGGLLLLPADFGISQSAARFIAESLGDEKAAGRILAGALRVKCITGGGVSLLLFASAGAIAAAYGEPALAWPLRAVALALFGQTVMALYSTAFLAFRRVSVNLRIVALESVAELTASVALVALGGGAAGAAFGRAAGYATGAAIALGFAIARLSPGVLRIRKGTSPVRQMARYGSALLIVDGVYSLFSHIDVLLIGAILGSSSVGLFSAPLKLTALLHYPGLAVSNAISPRVARHADLRADVSAFVTALRYLVIFQAAIAGGIVVWAEPITQLLLGSGYGASAGVLRALAPYVFLQGLAPLLSVSVNYVGQARRRVPIAIAAVLINLAIDVVLIPKIGIIAGAIGTSVAYAVYVPAHFRICRSMLDLPVAPLLRTVGRSVLAAGAMAGVMAAFGTSDLGWTAWVGGLLAGAMMFLVVIVTSGEVRLAEFAAARRLLLRSVAGISRGHV
jgi:O-antigen/teichoic acid export membrane protein